MPTEPDNLTADTTPQPLESLRVLLDGIIDYAGLFPPSQLSMERAVENYASYRSGKHRWMLGRFVLPAARLEEFIEARSSLDAGVSGDKWHLAVTASEDIFETIKLIDTFNRVHADSAVADVLEVKANTVSKIENTVSNLPPEVTAYFEIATGEPFAELVTALSIKKQRAKIRTGGVTNDAFPSTKQIIRFVRTCMAANVPFKATAGLHHPIRCFKPLTYAADAPQGTMHGFLNMLMMTGFVRESYRVSYLEELMEEEFEEVFRFNETGVKWRDEHFLSTNQLHFLRAKGFQSFGSCSFDEPIADLEAMGLL